MKASLFLALMLIVHAPATLADDYESLGFLVGCWATEGSFESWGEQSGGLMLGSSKSVREGSARAFEFLRIQRVEDGVLYVPYINGTEAAAFRLDAVSSSSAVFVNPENDFPQSIRYELVDDQLQVTLMGDEEPMRYQLARVSCTD